jgi:hypothetical protein
MNLTIEQYSAHIAEQQAREEAENARMKEESERH